MGPVCGRKPDKPMAWSVGKKSMVHRPGAGWSRHPTGQPAPRSPTQARQGRLSPDARPSPEAEVVRRANAAVAHRLQATPAADSAAEDERPSATPAGAHPLVSARTPAIRRSLSFRRSLFWRSSQSRTGHESHCSFSPVGTAPSPPPVPPKDTPPATRAASPRCGGRLAACPAAIPYPPVQIGVGPNTHPSQNP